MSSSLYTCSISDRSLSRDLILDNLTLEVERYSRSIEFGCKNAQIRAEGTHKDLRQLITGLRGNVTISRAGEGSVYWGCLWAIEFHIGRLVYTVSLEDMANDIDIQYLLQTINQQFSGIGSKALTGFLEDTASVTEYGRIQKRLRGANGSSSAAIARRAREIEARKRPRKNRNIAEDGNILDSYAILTVRSWSETIAWLLYDNLLGNAAGFESSSTITSYEEQLLGFGQSALSIEFTTNNTLRTYGASFAHLLLGVGSYFFVENSVSNNGIAWTVQTVIDGGGVGVTVTPTTVTSETDSSCDIIHVGTMLWQTFALETDNPFYSKSIDLYLRKADAATDNVIIELYTVNGSSLPDTLLATATITNDKLPTTIGWATATFDTESLISFGVTYGLRIRRSSGAFADSEIAIGLDTSLSYTRGSLKLYTNATIGWKSRPTNADLIFKLSGVVQTTDQIAAIVSGNSQYVTSSNIIEASGLRTLPYQDGSLTSLQVIRNLMEYGTSDEKRLFSNISEERVLQISKEPNIDVNTSLIVDEDGTLRYPQGEPYPVWRCPVGIWILFTSLFFESDDERYDMIDECEFNVAKGKLRVTRWRNNPSLLAITRFIQ